MRIVGGRFKGRAIAGPAGDGGAARLRPSSDRLREAVFNLLAHGDYPSLEGARVLDLFAGTGAMGLEALSRGAARVQFIDDGTEARALLRQNIENFDVIGDTKIFRRDATRLGANRGRPSVFSFSTRRIIKVLATKRLHRLLTVVGFRKARSLFTKPTLTSCLRRKNASHRWMRGVMASVKLRSVGSVRNRATEVS